MKLYFWYDAVTEPTMPFFLITSQKFFDKNGYLDDSGKEEKHVPEGFFSLQDSTYEYDGDPEEGKKKLLAAGHIEKNMLNSPVPEPTPAVEAPKKEVKTFTVAMYTIVVSLDDQMEESFSVEGSSTTHAFEKFIHWYLIFRSKKFPNLAYADIEGVIKSAHEVVMDAQDFVVGVHETVIPVKNEAKEAIGQVALTGTFSKAMYGMFL